jgi:hypothetical protein
MSLESGVGDRKPHATAAVAAAAVAVVTVVE